MSVHPAYAMIATMDDGSDDLAFAWAVREQESLWFACDHGLMEAAKGGWQDDADVRKMLQVYGLLRGQVATLLAGDGRNGSRANEPNRRKFTCLAMKQAALLDVSNIDGNAAVWHEFGRKLAEALGQPMGVDDWFMASGTAKIMWFHKPAIVPMYDRYAAKESGSSKQDFFRRCHDLLTTHQKAIVAAKALWGSAYPYDIRILDKFLWVKGKPDGNATLATFKAGCMAFVESQG